MYYNGCMVKKINKDKSLFVRNLRCVKSDEKRLLIGFKNNDEIFQIILLPSRDLGVEYCIKYNHDYYGGIRWNTEKNRKTFVWYKNLLFECNVNSKRNWTIYDLKNKSVVCIMRNNYVYKDYDQYKKIKKLIDTTKNEVQLNKQKDNLDKEKNIAMQVVEQYIKKFDSLYLQIFNKDLLKKEIIENLIGNYIYSDGEQVIIDWQWIEEDIESWFKNFIFAERYKDKIKDIVTIEFIYEKIPSLKNISSDIVESVYKEVISEQCCEQINFSIDNILFYIKDEIDSIEYRKQIDLEEIKKQEIIKMKELEFDDLYEKLINNFELEYYYTPFYEVVEKGKRIEIDEIKWNKFVNYETNNNCLTNQELLEYQLIFKTLKPRYDLFILGKRKTKRLVIVNLRKHIQYFEKIVNKLYEFKIIKDIGDVVEVDNYLEFHKFQDGVYY